MKAFVSYSHKDKHWREELQKWLVQLERDKLIQVWMDLEILPGERWNGEIKKELEDSQLIIYLITQNFIASDYIYKVELEHGLKAARLGEKCIIPVLCEVSTFKHSPLSRFQWVPRDKTIEEYDNKNKAWQKVYDELWELLKKRQPDPFALKKSRQKLWPLVAAAIVGAVGMSFWNDGQGVVPWDDILTYGAFGVCSIAMIAALVTILLSIPQVAKISEYLTLAEREMNNLLRGWGGGLSPHARDARASERIKWAQQQGTREAMEWALEINSNELHTGGPQARSMSKARFTALLLREIYKGNVKDAQLKIFKQVKSGNSDPYIAPGIREIVGYDKFNENDVENNGFPPGAGVGWFPLLLTVKLNRYPRNIIMVRSDKTVAYNRTVIDELTKQL